MARVAGTALAPVAPVEIDYPSSDGEPVAESYFQLIPLFYAFDALQRRYAAREDVFVAADLLLYYREGNPAAVVAPDVFVVIGAANHPRHSYQLWKEPKGPDLVLEITSASTKDRDQGAKRELYRELGVREYWQFDPTGDYLEPSLQGLELIGGRYQRLPLEELADGTLRLKSKVLGLEVRTVLGLEVRKEEEGLRFYDPATGSYLRSSAEEEQQRLRAEEELQLEAAARRQTEARLHDEAAARRQTEARLHDEAAARRQTEARLHDEAAARRQAEERVAELEAMLRERGENSTRSR